jgi:hypothetical protein
MKKILLATALSFCVSSAFAAETAVLKVTGTLTNAACIPELSNGGVVDYGNIHLGELSSTSVNQLGQKEIDLTINCTSPTKVGWSMIDDRSSSRAGITIDNATASGGTNSLSYYQFGVGQTSGNVNIGNYGVFVKDSLVTVDGETGDVIGRNSDWATNKWSATGAVRSDNYMTISVAATGTTEPLAFTTATFPLVTSLAIQDTTTLNVTDDTKLDGQATISLVYL